jgi:hypothetical protein
MEFNVYITAKKIDTLSMYINAESREAALVQASDALYKIEHPICDVRRLEVGGRVIEVAHQESSDTFGLDVTRVKGATA